MRKALVGIVLLFSLSLGAQEPSGNGVEVHGLMGGVVSLASDAGTDLTPFAAISVDVPIADSFYAPHLLATPILTALPGETLDLGDARTFRAIEFSVGLVQPLSKKVHFSLYGEFGAATRLPGDPAPRQRTARWLAGGVRFSGPRGLLAVMFGGDERLSGVFAPALLINGTVSLKTFERFANMNISLVGRGILGLDPYGTGAKKDIVQVGLAAGI